MVRTAALAGAQLVCTPEMTSVLDRRPGRLEQYVGNEETDAALKAFQEMAKAHDIIIELGSIAIRTQSGALVNRSYLINAQGVVVASYDKIHMFDADLSNGESYRESKRFEAGAQAVLAELPQVRIGLTICYDVRFPKLYWHLAQSGAQIITVPAAFTVATGQAHWEVLLRARAIETGSFVVAAAQGGVHEDGSHTYGHSLIIDPWGKIIAKAENDEPQVVLADIDLAEVDAARTRIPNLKNEKIFIPVRP